MPRLRRVPSLRLNCFETDLFRNMFVSRRICFETDLFRDGFVSRRVCFETCSFRDGFVSRRICFEMDLFRDGFVSRQVRFETDLFQDVMVSRRICFETGKKGGGSKMDGKKAVLSLFSSATFFLPPILLPSAFSPVSKQTRLETIPS